MKKLLPIVLLILAIAVASIGKKNFTADVKAEAFLNGEVTWCINSGETVTEGTELIRIRTLTGEIAAARSEINGTVSKVLVKPGDQIKRGDVVARLAE